MNSSVKNPPHVLTVKEVAQYLKLSEMTILRLANQGTIPGTKFGRQWRFSSDIIFDMIRNPEILKRVDLRK